MIANPENPTAWQVGDTILRLTEHTDAGILVERTETGWIYRHLGSGRERQRSDEVLRLMGWYAVRRAETEPGEEQP